MTDLIRRIGGTPPVTLRIVFLMILSITLMLVDHRTQQLERLRGALHTVVHPIVFLSTIPGEAIERMRRGFEQRSSLRIENERLRQENLLLRSRMEKLYSLEADNERLKQLLGQSQQLAERVLLAGLVEVSLEPYTQQIVLNRGLLDEVYLGQPVINGEGVIGQVVHVSRNQAIVSLLTDPDSATPVMVMRNGLRGVVFGTGVSDRLSLPYLTSDADIVVGDLLVSSGMGGRYPPGYPVASVSRIIRDASKEFLTIEVTPVARLDHGREVLLIWPDDQQNRDGGDDGA